MTTDPIQSRIVLPDRLADASSRRRTPRIVGYRAAAHVYGLDGIPELTPEFLVPHGTWRRSPFDHQRRRLEDIEFVEVEGGLITTVRQTLGDLCAVVPLDVVERAAESALRQNLVEELELRDFAAIFAFSRHGTPGLREVLDRRPIGAPPTGSDLETMCLQAFRLDPAIPVPQRQWPIYDADGDFVAYGDFGFPPWRFVVETDGLMTHKTVDQLQYDTDRQNRIWSAVPTCGASPIATSPARRTMSAGRRCSAFEPPRCFLANPLQDPRSRWSIGTNDSFTHSWRGFEGGCERRRL